MATEIFPQQFVHSLFDGVDIIANIKAWILIGQKSLHCFHTEIKSRISKRIIEWKAQNLQFLAATFVPIFPRGIADWSHDGNRFWKFSSDVLEEYSNCFITTFITIETFKCRFFAPLQFFSFVAFLVNKHTSVTQSRHFTKSTKTLLKLPNYFTFSWIFNFLQGFSTRKNLCSISKIPFWTLKIEFFDIFSKLICGIWWFWTAGSNKQIQPRKLPWKKLK